jgi:hypothetical protein
MRHFRHGGSPGFNLVKVAAKKPRRLASRIARLKAVPDQSLDSLEALHGDIRDAQAATCNPPAIARA